MTDLAFNWAASDSAHEPPADYYCPTRDVADGRMPKLFQYAIENGIAEQKAALLTALAAELTANCFDHNLGTWKDVPGCWFSFESDDGLLQIVVADRGQGILQSLKHADDSLSSHQDALITALTKQVSGRQPERRGRGLKFLIASLNQEFSNSRFSIQTGDAQLQAVFPVDVDGIAASIEDQNQSIVGTYAKLEINNNVK